MSFDYFYGPDDAEQYSFYRIPKRLITGDEFQETSTEAKLLYGLMLDRLQLSIRNQWLDSLNRVYIIYTVEDIIINFNAQDQIATLYTRDPAVMRKVDALVIEYPDTFKCIGETDIDKTYEMPKSVVTYRKPRRISDERRSQLQKIMGNINKL